MVKKKTMEFVNQNREMLQTVAKHGSTSASRIAEAMILAVEESEKNQEDAR